jgi:hypothetical protein
MSVENLIKKKRLDILDHATGACAGWALAFELPGIPFVDPVFANVKLAEGDAVHGVAFQISAEQAAGLDRQEGAYDVVPVQCVAYDGRVIEGVGLYVPKDGRVVEGTKARPSRRYLGLLQRGAREAGLDAGYVERLDRHPHHVTPAAVRAQTQRWIAEFEQDPARRGVRWTAEELARFDGSAPDRPAHTSAMGYVVAYEAWFTSWRGHTITRRNLLHVRGESVDAMDIRAGEPGFLPLPDLSACSPEEQEFLWQNLEHLLHGGGRIVGRLQEFLDAQP